MKDNIEIMFLKRRSETAARFENELTDAQKDFYDKNPITQLFLGIYADYIVSGKGNARAIGQMIWSRIGKDSFWLYVDEMTYRKMENNKD
jgi:hypothetical protein